MAKKVAKTTKNGHKEAKIAVNSSKMTKSQMIFGKNDLDF